MYKRVGLITGLEMNANVLDTLLNDISIQTLGKSWSMILTGFLVFVPVAGYNFFFPRQVLLISLLFSGLTLALSAGLLRGFHYWYGPSPVLAVLASGYLFWHWQRLRFFTTSLFKQRQLAKATLHSIADAVITTDAEGLIVYINPAAEKLTGFPLETAQGLHIDSVIRFLNTENINTEHGFSDFIDKLLNGRSIKEKTPKYIITNSGDEFAIQISGSPIKGQSGKISGVVFAISDITDILQTSRKISYLATHDPLTGLANRTLFYEQIEKAIASCHRQENYLAVLFIDLDDFKKVNDGMGHAVGDLLLTEVAERLLAGMRQIDTVARWGGDEFVVLLNQLASEENITGIVVKLLERLSQPFNFEGLTLYVTPSIGISVFPKDGSTSEELLVHADAAMFQVKENGRNGFLFFSSGFDKSANQRLVMEKEMYSAREEGYFEVFYQPQIDTKTNRIIGAEALLRWQHPHKGFISPDSFIPLAEETGFINQLGDWVLQTVCKQLSDWQKQGLPEISVAVNLSPRQFLQNDLCEKISQALKDHNVKACFLKVEITERLMIKNVDKVAQMLWDIRALGVCVSIDDFGTGYSSLSVLKNFPIDQLKIDKFFIRHLGTNTDDAKIAQSIIMLGHNMCMNVVAEGVETQAQLDFLREWNCDFIQGYHFSRPLTPTQMTELLQRGDSLL
jgi:diguanylate cyclase (GGDEF)-like protein/PAS domain S-box-containing protein